MSTTDGGDQEETILEYAVRERLTKEQVSELLASLGGKTQGSRDDLAERLLAIKGLKPKDALSKLSVADLKLVVRRFGVPEPAKPATASAFLGSLLSDEKSSLVKRLDDAALKQRVPAPRASPQGAVATSKSAAQGTPTMVAPAAEAREISEPQREVTASNERASETPRPPAVSRPAGTAVGLPVFEETRDFVGAYNFAYQWDEEDYYEAELLGALRGRFGMNNAVRQQGESGRVYDIVVRNSARIEVKLPKQKAELDRMIGQVGRYLSQHPGGVIVVIVGFTMRDQQEIHNAREDLERAGAVVFLK